MHPVRKPYDCLRQSHGASAVRATLGNYPKLGKEAASRIPHVRLIEFSDHGQAPDVFHKLLSWLDEHATGSVTSLLPREIIRSVLRHVAREANRLEP